jgi:hypothetical protein
LKLDHFFHAQARRVCQEQVKYVSGALRVEETLK